MRPIAWMFLAILVTFGITRTVTRLIRSGRGGRAGLGNVRIAGTHIHHQVFGILIIIGTGIVLVSEQPRGAGLDAAAAVFGVGVGLTVDEFALWLQLEDVDRATEGRKSVDAIFCVLVITGALLGGTSFVTGPAGTTGWWWSVFVLAAQLALCVTCVLKGKITTGVIGIVFGFAALAGAGRLAKRGSWWAATAIPAGPGAPPAPPAVSTSGTRRAGTGYAMSSPVPPPSPGLATPAATRPRSPVQCCVVAPVISAVVPQA